MKHNYLLMNKVAILVFAIIILLSSCQQTEQKTINNSEINQLREGFITPPLEARPRALWDWVDGNFSLDEITHEMEEAKAKGMGGFDIWDVRSVTDAEKIVPAGPAFMSDESLEGIIHAINEAERLNIDLGLIVASGWNAGGSWTKPEHQTMGLFRSEKKVKGPGNINIKIDFPDLPKGVNKKGRKIIQFIPKNEDGLPKYYSEVKVIAIPTFKDSIVLEKSMILDISDKMDTKGNIKWKAPKGDWKIIRYICSNTGQGMISSTPNSKGPMIDHFNPEATVEHINFFIDKIEEKLGKPIGESGLKYFYTDSYEVTGLLWTEELINVFEKQMGYSMIPFMPVFDGFVVDNKDVTNRFLYDHRKVWSDLIINSHYKKATEICESHGIGFVAEAAGPGMPIHNCPFESLKSSGALSFPRGEFWHIPNKNDFWKKETEKVGNRFLNDLQVIKGVASASHIYNQKYVEAEAFTGVHIYTEGPGDLKPTADRAFAEGLNRIIFHTWPHTPKVAGTPGWSYSFGTLMHENRIWWPKAKPWMDYLGRTSFMLQQGNFVGDLMFFYGDSVPNFVPPKKLNPSLGFGYDYDACNSDILINKLEVENGKLVLPHGQKYEVLVLPDEDYMVYDVLEKIESLVSQGATVIGRKPIKSHGLKDWKQHDEKVQNLANKMWGDCNGRTITENNYGKGKVVWGKLLKDVLENEGVSPDFDFKGNVENNNLSFIHRTTNNSEIYFIRNSLNREVFGEAIFRITGKQPEIWDPVTGKSNRAMIFTDDNEKTILPLYLEPNGSTFIVFTKNENKQHFVKVVKDRKQIFPITNDKIINELFVYQKKDSDTEQLIFNSKGEYILDSNGGEQTIVKVDKKINPVNLTGSWQVHFPKKEKGVGDVVFDKLESWTNSKVFDLKFFSGIASYEKTFKISEDIDFNNLNIVLDLGEVKEIAHVFVNGKDAGISWVKPYQIDISKLVKKGENTLKIEVANTWHNRLSGDAKLPKSERISKTNITKLPTPWQYSMENIPFDNEDGKYDLLESGLLGPVKIIFLSKFE